MTKYTKTIGALAATTMLMGGYATAGAPPVTPMPIVKSTGGLEGEINVGYTNMYEFRFVDVGQDLVSAGADVAYDFGNGWAINAGAWYGSTSDTKPFGRGAGSFNELDLYAGLSKSFGEVDFEVGYIFYHFLDKVAVPGGFSSLDTQEIYASASMQFGGGFGANMTAFYDIQRYNGLYVNTEATYSVELSHCLTLDLAAGVAWADGHGLQASRGSALASGLTYFGGTVDGYQGYYLSAAMPWAATENLTVTPFMKYTNGDSDLLTNTTDVTGGQDYFIAGLSLAVSF